ncbi:glycine zipper 2TM domain-containing protein [Sulfurimonas paralvinellae]|uniref:Glycine zipper 2TM domain-containing protein n=1 Tax=Sulfurimonas paralvinellae TaxID=317658 RepID=A0A7M1B885_9BACT|nr:glycine zipper 2TM domain-containing protein [Sulfurimonas paralvinellae]QOP44952.1 glycine zipper 2TM domain-containing protein [Sulfurimonas paralvinellae]
MKKFLTASSIIAMLILSGCATNSGPEYDGSSYREIKTYEIGTVRNVRPVVVSDSGTGTFLGAIVGTVIGSTMGGGRGTALTTLAGGLVGAYAGNQAGKANASELSVMLDDGRDIVVVVKGSGYSIGDRVKIIKDGKKVDQVYKID